MDFFQNCVMQHKERFPLIACPDCRTQMRHVSGSPSPHRICPCCGSKFDPSLAVVSKEPKRPASAPREPASSSR